MFLYLLLFWAASLSAQTPPAQGMEHDHSQMDHSKMDHSKMDHSQMDHSQMDHATMDHSGMHHNASGNDPESYLLNLASGTSMNPRSCEMPMIMPRLGSWNIMLMGQGFLVDTQQTGPRGGDKLYSANWGMISAERKLGRGSVMIQTMFSLDPATVTSRSYPLLFQTGETAYGKPLVDAQHPHDFIMGLGIHYARPISESVLFHAYYAPVGDPALGPVAFPHRASAGELPQATLSHHLQDSSHIANNVATVALQRKWLRLEASGFYGSEPNENRWNIDWGPMNSYSGRISVTPSANWLAQVSAGRLKNPERQADAREDVVRSSASVHYTKPMAHGNSWSTSLIWGRNHNTLSKHNTNSYLLETLYPLSKRNFATARVELVDKDELFGANAKLEDRTFRIQAYTVGFTRDAGSWRKLTVGVGANITFYGVPGEIQPYYGGHPIGVSTYLRLRLRPPA